MEWKLFFFIFLIKVFFFCQQHQQMNCLKSRYLNSGCAYWDFFLSGNACLYSYSDTKVCMKSFCYHSTSHLRLTVSFGSFLILGFFFFFFFFLLWNRGCKNSERKTVNLPLFGEVTVLSLGVLLFCLSFAIAWAITRKASFSWIGQDVLVSSSC